jgi:hypothetical protein
VGHAGLQVSNLAQNVFQFVRMVYYLFHRHESVCLQVDGLANLTETPPTEDVLVGIALPRVALAQGEQLLGEGLRIRGLRIHA